MQYYCQQNDGSIMIFEQGLILIICLFMQDNHTILDIRARQIYDSRGYPTLQCEVITAKGVFRAAVPSGASTGKYEAHELRDNNPQKNMGKSVHTAVSNVNTIIKNAIVGKDCRKQTQIDKLMYEQLDGSKNQYGWNKAKLGANAILSVSMAICRAAAAAEQLPLYAYIRKLYNRKIGQKYVLPCPAFNVINGGKHGGNQLPMQQFMVLPTGAKSFSQAMEIGTDIYQKLKKIIHKKHGISAVNVGDEGGFAPPIHTHIEALQLITQSIQQCCYSQQISIAMDCAASQFYQQQSKSYNLTFKSKTQPQPKTSTNQLYSLYANIVQKYPIVSIEDGFDQDDWEGWCQLTEKNGKNLQVVGDDLLVTNLMRIEKALEKKACNALLLKVNQIGTITEAIQAARIAYDNGWGVMVSHRSGETQDTFISHLVVGLSTGQIKTGAPCRSQRLAKYNQLLRIEEQLGEHAEYAGNKCYRKKAQ